MKKEEITKINYAELEQIINKTFNVTGYEFVPVQECENDSTHLFVINKIEPLNKWDTDTLKEFISENGFAPYANYVLFQELVNRGVLSIGQYLVVSW